MKRSKRTFVVIVTCLMVLTCTGVARADGGTVNEIFRDTLYGGLTGMLIGGALLAFTNKPADHLQYVGYGGAAGVIAGASYGFYRSTRALAELENGKVKFAIPTIIPDFRDDSRGHSSVAFNAKLIHGKF